MLSRLDQWITGSRGGGDGAKGWGPGRKVDRKSTEGGDRREMYLEVTSSGSLVTRRLSYFEAPEEEAGAVAFWLRVTGYLSKYNTLQLAHPGVKHSVSIDCLQN